jgi:hypothetical protein
MSMDVYSLGLKHVHGGQSKVLGIHDHYSTFNYLVLLKDESTDEIIRGWREFYAYCQSKKVVPRHVHTDNGSSFVSHAFREFMQREIKAQFTTIAPYSPRSNATWTGSDIFLLDSSSRLSVRTSESSSSGNCDRKYLLSLSPLSSTSLR